MLVLILYFGPLNCHGGGQFILLILMCLQYNHTQSSYKLLKAFIPKHLSRLYLPTGLFFYTSVFNKAENKSTTTITTTRLNM